MQKILVVDDEENILHLIEFNLKNAGFNVVTAGNGHDAVHLVEREQPHLVVLDVMLPGIDGFEVVKQVRKFSRVPILMLTARVEEFDRVLGLELGADDYLVKPFSPRELIARVKAILRRSGGEPLDLSGNLLKAGEISIDEARHMVMVGDCEVDLTAKEYEMLKLLVKNRGRVFTREKLLELLWDVAYYGDNRTIDVHIRHLREKIEPEPANPRYIKTVRGVGYKFEE